MAVFKLLKIGSECCAKCRCINTAQEARFFALDELRYCGRKFFRNGMGERLYEPNLVTAVALSDPASVPNIEFNYFRHQIAPVVYVSVKLQIVKRIEGGFHDG